MPHLRRRRPARHRCLLRRAADAAREVLRPAVVPFRSRYDLVGVIELVGAGSEFSGGERVAALTKIGAWADRVLLDTAHLVPVPNGVDPVEAETVAVNGVTAWRMLHQTARISAGDTIVVLGAAGGLGSTLVQLARHAGVTVLGTAGAAQQDRVRDLGAIAIDYLREDVPARVKALAPGGVTAVFDHVGGPGIFHSWRMLAPGGTLVSYGTASTRDDAGNPRLPVLKLLARLMVWNMLPNGRRATFFNLWAGRARHLDRHRSELRRDLGAVLALLAEGAILPQVARRFPLQEAAAAMRYAEAGGITGKVVLVPGNTLTLASAVGRTTAALDRGRHQRDTPASDRGGRRLRRRLPR